ncbi:MAG: response regulator [Candidatus Omnitrophota bacterium]
MKRCAFTLNANRYAFILTILVFGLIFLYPIHLYSEETGYKYLKNYNYKEYDHQPQNWGMTQAPNGIIYTANQAGVLEFDGVSWRVINIPNYTVRSIAVDKTGTIYIGGKNEIGFLAPDAKGKLEYNSLRQFLPKNRTEFSDVWKTYISEKGVYFHTSKYLFRWDSQKMKVWEPVDRFYFSFVCEGKFFIRQANIGLMEMIDDSLKLVPGGNEFISKKIFMMAPYNDGKILIGTDTDGFYLYTGTGIMPFPTEVDNYLKKNILYHGIRLSSGDYALATLRGGVVIMDTQGRLKCIWDKTSGLQDNCVHYVFEDNGTNLWLCLDKGISKIENISPISIHDERSGLYGLILTIMRHSNNLYVGTTEGLFHLELPFKFSQIKGIASNCWSLLSTGDSLLVGTSEGVYLVEKGKKSQLQVIKAPTFVLLQSRYRAGRIWCGTADRLVMLSRKNGQWLEEIGFNPINQEIRSIAEEKNGNLWLVTTTGSVIKVDFLTDSNQPVFTWYEISHGLAVSRVYAAYAANHVIFATEKGLFRYDEKKDLFIPDLTLGTEFAGGKASRNVFRIAEGIDKNIWVHSESRNYLAIPTAGGPFTIYNTPFRRIPLIQVNAIYPDSEEKIAWLASFDGLIRYDPTVKKNYSQPFHTLVRKIMVNEEIIFDGYKDKTNEADHASPPAFPYQNRNLHFEFAAPFFEAETETQYRCYLEGYDHGWSTWSKDAKRNYTNLDPGDYIFRVQAKNIYEQLGHEDVFRFKVLPPWYREWWAFWCYGTGIFGLMFIGMKWRSAKLLSENEKLEATIKDRTQEIQTKNLQLKEQSTKLEEMDRIKSRFFANLSHEFRTPLTLIIGPIEQMLSDTRENRQQQELSTILRNAKRLLNLINQLLDLSRFDSGHAKLNATNQDMIPFLKSILSSFHLIAPKKQLDLEFQSERDSIFLYFDTGKMEVVVYNLLINAFKFTSAGGKITVSVSLEQPQTKTQVSQQSGFLVLSIRDTGIGIPKEQFPYIFDRFYQVKNSNQAAMKGTGIGLSLTKENVVLHHGRIDVHSLEGKGTEFVIRLPLGHEHLKPDEIMDASFVPINKSFKDKEIEALTMITGIDEIKNNDPLEDGEMQQYEDTDADMNEAALTIASPKNKKLREEKPVILVVEDHVEVRKYICDPLRQGYTIVEAGDGKEGIEKATEIIPDLIVSDIMMPEVDGYELCRKLKTDIKTSHIPIILLTAKASEDNIIEGLETGADDYIAKPFNPKILLTRIKNLIELRRQLQQKIQKQMLLQPAEIVVSSMDREFIEEIQSIIEKNLSNTKFNVEQMSKKLYMNRATLYRKMMALTGETPTEFIRSYRLKRAAQLLKDKFGNVSQVSLAVGFSNMAYFAKCFKEKFNRLPSSYQASESK